MFEEKQDFKIGDVVIVKEEWREPIYTVYGDPLYRKGIRNLATKMRKGNPVTIKNIKGENYFEMLTFQGEKETDTIELSSAYFILEEPQGEDADILSFL